MTAVPSRPANAAEGYRRLGLTFRNSRWRSSLGGTSSSSVIASAEVSAEAWLGVVG